MFKQIRERIFVERVAILKTNMANNSQIDEGHVVECPKLDRISDLPANVVDDILVRLSLRDAVRTSVLSRKWRHRWEYIPQLAFDQTFLHDLERWQRKQSTVDESGEEIFPDLSNEILMKTICQVLLLHSGLLRKFTLSVITSCSEFDRLIHFLSRKDIEDFEFCHWSEAERHKLPSSFFSFSQLRCLKLKHCAFRLPSMFKGFNSLITLEFEGVDFDPEFYKNFIPNCPVLEKVRLVRCSKVDHLEINAPSLKVLVCHGTYDSVCFKKTPLLSILSLHNHSGYIRRSEPEKGPGHLVVLPSNLPAIQQLVVNDHFLKIMDVEDVWTRPPTSLWPFKILRVSSLYLSEAEDLSRLLCLIRNAPHLRKLSIKPCLTYDGDSKPSLQLLEALEHSDFSLNQLLAVEL